MRLLINYSLLSILLSITIFQIKKKTLNIRYSFKNCVWMIIIIIYGASGLIARQGLLPLFQWKVYVIYNNI